MKSHMPLLAVAVLLAACTRTVEPGGPAPTGTSTPLPGTPCGSRPARCTSRGMVLSDELDNPIKCVAAASTSLIGGTRPLAARKS